MDVRNEIEQAKIIGFAIGKFYEDEEFMNSLKGTGVFKGVAHLLDKYPDDCIDLICAFDGVTRENATFDRKNIFGKLIKIISSDEIMGAFQSAE